MVFIVVHWTCKIGHPFVQNVVLGSIVVDGMPWDIAINDRYISHAEPVETGCYTSCRL